MKKAIAFICVFVALAVVLCTGVCAEPTDSFTHYVQADGKNKSGLSQDMFTASKLITASSLGLDKALTGLSDICCGKDGRVYLLAGEKSEIVVLNNDYSLLKAFELYDSDNNKVTFEGAQGIYVDSDNKIFVADTRNSRIIITDISGKVSDFLTQPESDIIPDDFFYQPYRLLKDNNGYTYILSLGCYYGALQYSPENEFMGFYGANTTDATASDTISFIWDKFTKNDQKKKYTAKNLPYSFVDIAMDPQGYLITCTGRTDEKTNGAGQIRKISAGGHNILYKRDTNGKSILSTAYNFLEDNIIKFNGETLIQNIVSVDCDNNGIIYALDQTFSLIYVYDSNCNLLGGFGGGTQKIKQLGVFSKAVSVKSHGTDVLVVDSDNNAVTVFNLTEYGSLLMEAQQLYNKGDYADAKPLWEQILSQNRANQQAYRGLAIAYYSEGKYQKALEYAKAGMDYMVYDLAWQAILKKFIADHFILLIIPVAILLGLIIFLVFSKKKLLQIKNLKVKYALRALLHPFDSFRTIKEKNLCSYRIAIVLNVMLLLSGVLKDVASGFLFSSYSPVTYNIFISLLRTVCLLLLWAVSNWLVGCLLTGNASFKEVYVASTYAIMPVIAYNLIYTLLSYVLPLSGVSFINGLEVIMVLYIFFLMSVAIMEMQEYDFKKFIITGILTILLMMLIAFVIFLIGILFQQIWETITTVYTEISYR